MLARTCSTSQCLTFVQVQALPINKDRILKFMWVDLACHPSFGEQFDIRIDTYEILPIHCCHSDFSHACLTLVRVPTLVAVLPKKGKYLNLVGSYTESSVSAFITGVLGGKHKLATFDKVRRTYLFQRDTSITLLLLSRPKLTKISADENCAAIHEANKPVVEEHSEDLDELLKYAVWVLVDQFCCMPPCLPTLTLLYSHLAIY